MRNLVNESRTRLQWSQQKLADELGVSRQTIISLERGRFDPSLPLAFRLAAIFETTLEDLFFPDGAVQDAASSKSSSVRSLS